MAITDQVSAETTELLDMSVAADGTVVGVDPSGTIVRWDEGARKWSAIDGQTANLTQVSVASDQLLWGLDSAGAIYQIALTEDSPARRIPGQLTQLSAAADGTVWGVGPNGEALRYSGDAGIWEVVATPNPLRRISVASANQVVALDTHGKLHSYRDQGEWQAIDGSFQDVSAAADGSVWAIDASGQASLYLGGTYGWHSFPGTLLRRISACSVSNVWGMDANSCAADITGGRAPFAEVDGHHQGPRVEWDAQDPFDDVQSTHLWIVNQAARLATFDPDPAGWQIFDLIKPGQKEIGDPFHDRLCQGLYDADYLKEYNGPPIALGPLQSWAGHFYDPFTGLNWQGDERNTALNNCRQYAVRATGPGIWMNLVAGHAQLRPPAQRGSAGYNLGLGLHYLTDVTQPMHAANFIVGSSHPVITYHSTVEWYVMTQQAKVTPPTYAPPTNGPLAQTCPKRANGCSCTSACRTLDLYCKAAALNSRTEYHARLRDTAQFGYWGWPGMDNYWPKVIDPLIAPMLRDAILVTAQFLVAWMQSAKVTFDFPSLAYQYGPNWKRVGGYMTSLAVAADGTVWGVNARQPTHESNVYRLNGTAWIPVRGYLTQIAVGSASQIWGVNARQPDNENNIYRWNGTTWVGVKGYLTSVGVAADGTVWGVNARQPSSVSNVYRWDSAKSDWVGEPGYLTHIAVGSASQIWGVVNSTQPGNSNVFRWDEPGKKWTAVTGYLTNVAVAADGTVRGVNNTLDLVDKDNIFAWNKDRWVKMTGHLTQIGVGSALQVWGVNGEQSENNIYRNTPAG